MNYTEDNPLKLFSFGGGVQSHAVLLMQIKGLVNYDAFIFANVGNDSESPKTIAYMDEVTRPLCEKYGINLIEVQKTTFGEPETLVKYIYRTPLSVPIPARTSNGAPGSRSCTNDFKISVVDKWVKQQDATHCIVGLGISLDEIRRMRDEDWHDMQGKSKIGFFKKRQYPLIDNRMNRNDCHKIAKEFNLPQVPKSACYFCPFTKHNEWIELKKNQPAEFNKAIELENHINTKRGATGSDRVFLHASATPLNNAVGNQLAMDDLLDECDGYCHT
jgi:hypothetical protein